MTGPGAHVVGYVTLGLQNLWRYKLRSGLTALGMIFGVGAVVAMLAVAGGARGEILSQLSSLGMNNLIVKSKRPPKKADEEVEGGIYQYGLTFNDVARVRATVPEGTRVVAGHVVRESISVEGREQLGRVMGVTPGYSEVYPLELRSGRWLTAADEWGHARICLLAEPFVRALPGGRIAPGGQVRVGRELFTAVGVFGWQGAEEADLSADDRPSVLLPYASALAYFGTSSDVEEGGREEEFRLEVDELVINDPDPLSLVRPVRGILAIDHEEADFTISVPLELLAQRRQARQVFDLVMLAIAAISLLTGGVGIVNIMLVSIAERTREIGIRRALGARQSDIVVQFLIETVTISVFGGVLGIVAGLAGAQTLEWATGWTTTVTAASIGAAFAVSCACGIVFGIYPAHRAARLDPVTALRHE